MLQFILFGVIWTFVIIYYFVTKKFDYWKVRKIPGPKPLPLFGNIKDTALRKENVMETLHKIYNQFPDSPVVGIFRMTNPCLLIRDLDIIKQIMIKDFEFFQGRGFELGNEGLCANLFHADGDTWRGLRHRFTPLFTTKMLKGMMYLIVEQCDKFITFLEESVAKQQHQEIYYQTQRYTMSSIMTCAFGISVDTLSESEMKILSEIDKLTFQTSVLYEIDMMFPKLFKNLNLSIFPKRVQNFMDEIVTNVIKERNEKPTSRNDFIDLVLEMKNQEKVTFEHEITKSDFNLSLQITDSIIAAQAFVFYTAAYETSATAIVYLLFELARHQELQDKVIEEVDSVLKKHNGKITYETLNDLSLVERCFNETYRKYPTIPLIRKSSADYKIPGTNITIEKGTVIVVSAFGIHYDKKYYPNPNTFDPDRFNPENVKDRHPCLFLTYGVGPRNCIGIRFGRLQTRICLLKLLSKFRIEPSPKTSEIVFDSKRVVASPAGGIYVKLIPRHRI